MAALDPEQITKGGEAAVPSVPRRELTALLHEHIAEFGTGPDGRHLEYWGALWAETVRPGPAAPCALANATLAGRWAAGGQMPWRSLRNSKARRGWYCDRRGACSDIPGPRAAIRSHDVGHDRRVTILDAVRNNAEWCEVMCLWGARTPHKRNCCPNSSPN
jgi:hypothetical protein